MRKEDLLAYVAIILSIPGVIALFAKQTAAGVMCMAIVVILLVIYKLLNRPIFTYLEVEKVLEFKDEVGQLAVQVSRFKARANHKGTTQLWFRGINADGSIENITIDGDPVNVKRVAGSLEIYKQWKTALTPGQVAPVELSYELHGSFLGKTQGITHITATTTKKVRIFIKFHPQRPVVAARHYLGYGGQVQSEMQKPVIAQDRLSLECEFVHPKTGSYHTIEWDW